MLMKISEYQMTFTPGSRPDRRTVLAWVRHGTLHGERRGNTWYVDPDRQVDQPTPLPAPSLPEKLHPLAQKVLAAR